MQLMKAKEDAVVVVVFVVIVRKMIRAAAFSVMVLSEHTRVSAGPVGDLVRAWPAAWLPGSQRIIGEDE